MVLDLASYQIQKLPSQGELPGWIFGHEAELGPEGIIIRGGEIHEEIGGEMRIRRNFDDFLHDPATGNWKRLTDRKWRQFSIFSDERKIFMKGVPFRGSCSMDAEPGKGEGPEMPDLGDTFIYVKPEVLFPRSFEYETVYWEEYSPEDRIIVDGIQVSIKVESFAIEVMIEGEMDEAKANALVQDIREGIEADIGRPCVVKNYA